MHTHAVRAHVVKTLAIRIRGSMRQLQKLGCRPDSALALVAPSCVFSSNDGGVVSGTIVCGVTDSAGGRDALQLAVALSRRLGLRLVLVFTPDEVPTPRRRRHGAGLLRELRQEFGLEEMVELRETVGEPAHSLAQIAAEEGADLIVLWSRRRSLRRHAVECRLAKDLEPMTAIPVVIAPPQTRPRSGRRLAVL